MLVSKHASIMQIDPQPSTRMKWDAWSSFMWERTPLWTKGVLAKNTVSLSAWESPYSVLSLSLQIGANMASHFLPFLPHTNACVLMNLLCHTFAQTLQREHTMFLCTYFHSICFMIVKFSVSSFFRMCPVNFNIVSLVSFSFQFFFFKNFFVADILNFQNSSLMIK